SEPPAMSSVFVPPLPKVRSRRPADSRRRSSKDSTAGRKRPAAPRRDRTAFGSRVCQRLKCMMNLLSENGRGNTPGGAAGDALVAPPCGRSTERPLLQPSLTFPGGWDTKAARFFGAGRCGEECARPGPAAAGTTKGRSDLSHEPGHVRREPLHQLPPPHPG